MRPVPSTAGPTGTPPRVAGLRVGRAAGSRVRLALAALTVSAPLALCGSSPARAQAVTLEDMNGRRVNLAGPAERIVALPLPSGPTLIALDRSERRLAGLHPTARSLMIEGPLGRVFPGLRDTRSSLLRAGGGAFMPNVEAIAALGADLVVQRGELGPNIVRPLEEAGLTVLLVSYGDEERARSNIRVLGAAIGQSRRAQDLVEWRQNVTDRLEAALGRIAGDARPGVLFLSGGRGDLAATGSGTPNDHAIRIAGGRNMAGALPGSVRLGIEQVLLWDPDVIVLNSGDRNLTPRSLAADPVLSALSAVRTGRVYKAPTGGYRLEPQNPENPLYWMWLAGILHPSAADFDLRMEFAHAFRLLYGAEPSAAEIDAMLQLSPNRDSAGYGRVSAKP